MIRRAGAELAAAELGGVPLSPRSPKASERKGAGKEGRGSEATAVRVLLALCVVELALWGFAKPLGRPIVPIQAPKHFMDAHIRLKREIRAAKHMFSMEGDTFELLPSGSALMNCCPKDRPHTDAVCMCLPGSDVTGDLIPARPWLTQQEDTAATEDTFRSLYGPELWVNITSSEEPDLSKLTHIPLANYMKLVDKHCERKILHQMRNGFADKRLNEILAYRKEIRVKTGCHPEDYDHEEGTFCGGTYTESTKVSKSEWVRQQEAEKLRALRLRQHAKAQQLKRAAEDGQEEVEAGERAQKSALGEQQEGGQQQLQQQEDAHRRTLASELRRVALQDANADIQGASIVMPGGSAGVASVQGGKLNGTYADTAVLSKPKHLSREDADRMLNPSTRSVQQLIQACVQQESRDRVAQARVEADRVRHAKEEESKKAAEVARYKDLLKNLEDESLHNKATKMKEGVRAQAQTAYNTLSAETKSKAERAALLRAFHMRSKEFDTMRDTCPRLKGKYTALVDEGNGLKDLTADEGAIKKLDGLQAEAKEAWIACKAEVEELEGWRAKLDAEVQKHASEKSTVDHMANLAKYQRRQSGGRNQ